MSSSNTVVVCGAGTMGTGIAQVAAMAGFTTIVYDVAEATIEKSKQSLLQSLEKLAVKNKLAQPVEETMALLSFTTNIQSCKGNLLIEAIIENLDAKQQLYQQLEAINHPETLLATNTSSLSVNNLAIGLKHPERFIGLHFFNPPVLLPLVEIVKTTHTSHQTEASAIDWIKSFGKTAVFCADAPGFIVNRVARPFYIEAMRLLEEGYATIETIDALLEARGFKMGPFRLMDLIGNDINYKVSQTVYEQLNKPERLRPSYLQEEKITQNKLGKKTGQGFYEYPVK